MTECHKLDVTLVSFQVPNYSFESFIILEPRYINPSNIIFVHKLQLRPESTPSKRRHQHKSVRFTKYNTA